VLLVAAAAAPSPALAARWDPRFRWNTLDTAHFSIHFHQGEGAMAIELAQVAEEAHRLLSPQLRWRPRGRTQVVLVDSTDGANGYASTAPYNAIVLFAAPPPADSSLANHENWLFSLFLHEYAHILQIDTISGLPQIARWLFGRLITPNAVMPRWLTEGFATYQETRLTAGGRGRSTYTDALLRVAALNGRWPAVDQAEGFGQVWPRGQARYLYGARFHFEVEERSSADAWVDFHQRHGRGVIPFILPAKAAFGATFARMWREWRQEMAAFYLGEAERISKEGQGLTSVRVLPTRPGMAVHGRYTRDGAGIVYVHQSPRERSSVRRIERDGTRDRRLLGGGAERGSWSHDGKHLFWAAAGSTNRYEAFVDLFRFDPEKKKRKRVTRGARLLDPAPHPEGGWLVAVQGFRGRTQLVRVDLPPKETDAGGTGEEPPEGREEEPEPGGGPEPAGLLGLGMERAFGLDGRQGTHTSRGDAETRKRGIGKEKKPKATVTPITAAEDGSHYSAPAWDPAGTRLAVSIWKPGGFRDIHVLDRHGHVLRVLSWDRALDDEPTWSPDGAFILWASDRDGVSNLYAYRWEDGAIFRVTRLLSAAREPDVSPDGRHLLFTELGPEGPRVVEMPFDAESWEPVQLDARAMPGPGWTASAQASAPLDPLEGVPGPRLPSGTGPAAAVARARARAGWDTLAEDPQPQDEKSLAPGPRERPAVPPRVGTLRRYNPLRTLLPPRYLALFGQLTERGALGGLATGGEDVLRQHQWGASVHYRTDSKYWGWSAGYALEAFRPRFAVAGSSIALDYGTLWERNPAPPPPGGTTFSGSYRGNSRYYERRDRLGLGFGIPIRLRQFLSFGYELEFRRPLRDLPADVDPRLLPARGSFSGIQLGWASGDFRSYPASISPEASELLTASAELESSYLGAYRIEADGSRSDLHRLILSVEGRKYLTLPWARNHVLALRFAVGATFGTEIPQRTFRLGGPYGDNPYVSLPDRYYMLRGYPSSSMRGDHIYLGTAEYRLPLVYIERGPWTLPAWFRSLSLTVFAEAGQAFTSADYAPYGGSPDGFLAFWRNTQPAVGVELLGDAVLGWSGLFQARIGYAVGFGGGAYPGGTFYAQLGTSF
jgi:hypothetical protein